VTFFITAVGGAVYWSLTTFWPLECQTFYGSDALRLAAYVLPVGFAIIFGIIIINFGITTFHGANRELLMASSIAMTVGTGLLAIVRPSDPGFGVGMTILAGIGAGGIVQPAVTMLTIISPDEIIATIAAMTISIRLVGAAIGYAISFNVLQSHLVNLQTNIATAVFQAGLPLNETIPFVGALLTHNKIALDEFPQLIQLVGEEALESTYLGGLKEVYLVNIAFGVAALVACLFLGNIKKYMVDRIAVDIH
jgi:hypothetical protein